MSIFDSHCHPQFPQYDRDRDEMVARAFGAGVSMICVGTDYETSKQSIELAQKYDRIWATVGLHPNDNLNEKFDPALYEKLLKQPKVVAFGEIGLDYYRTSNPEDQKFQRGRFIEQLDLAQKLLKPLVLHCRDGKSGSMGRAYPAMLNLLKNGYTENGGAVHSYTGSLDEARGFLDLGLYFGFNGIITFARQYDEIIRYISLDQVLLETDAPYLTPEPYRGQRNEPAHIIEVAKKIAELKNLTYETVVNQTTENCKKLFRLA